MVLNYLFFIILIVVSLRPISTLIHELGHGIPALILTNDKVTLYLGSYGNPENAIKISTGRLEIFFGKNPFHWKIGLCEMHSKHISINRQIFIYLMGPVMSLVLALVSSYYIFFVELNDFFIVFFFFYGLSAYFDFFANIIPKIQPIKLHNGTFTHNDGQNIKDLLKLKNLPSIYGDGIELYNNEEFDKAGEIFNKIIDSNYKEDNIYRLAISSYINAHNYKKAKSLNSSFEKKNKKKNFDSNDYNNSGLLKSYLKDYSKAMKDYEKSLELNPSNSLTLNNRGYTFNLLKEYDKAIKDFDRAIEIEPEKAYAYNNRGIAKIKLKKIDEGLNDIEKSMLMDKNNSYAHMNLGIYYYDIGDYKKALKKFHLAFELDKYTYEIQDRIEETERKLNLK